MLPKNKKPTGASFWRWGFARLDGACAKPASSPSQRKNDKRNTAPKAYCDRKS
jgi:hypothetical protein